MQIESEAFQADLPGGGYTMGWVYQRAGIPRGQVYQGVGYTRHTHIPEQNDSHLWKHYLPETLFKGGNYWLLCQYHSRILAIQINTRKGRSVADPRGDQETVINIHLTRMKEFKRTDVWISYFLCLGIATWGKTSFVLNVIGLVSVPRIQKEKMELRM